MWPYENPTRGNLGVTTGCATGGGGVLVGKKMFCNFLALHPSFSPKCRKLQKYTKTFLCPLVANPLRQFTISG